MKKDASLKRQVAGKTEPFRDASEKRYVTKMDLRSTASELFLGEALRNVCRLDMDRVARSRPARNRDRRRIKAIHRGFVPQPADAAARRQRQVNRDVL
jgi:hypothetical protein